MDLEELQQSWQQRTDEELTEAARRPGYYSPIGREVILAELKRRGFSPPEPATGPDLEPEKSLGLAVALAIVFGWLGMAYVRRLRRALLVTLGLMGLMLLACFISERAGLGGGFLVAFIAVGVLLVRLVVFPVWAVARVREINRD